MDIPEDYEPPRARPRVEPEADLKTDADSSESSKSDGDAARQAIDNIILLVEDVKLIRKVKILQNCIKLMDLISKFENKSNAIENKLHLETHKRKAAQVPTGANIEERGRNVPKIEKSNDNNINKTNLDTRKRDTVPVPTTSNTDKYPIKDNDKTVPKDEKTDDKDDTENIDHLEVPNTSSSTGRNNSEESEDVVGTTFTFLGKYKKVDDKKNTKEKVHLENRKRGATQVSTASNSTDGNHSEEREKVVSKNKKVNDKKDTNVKVNLESRKLDAIQIPIASNSTDRNNSEERDKVVSKNKKVDDKKDTNDNVYLEARKRDAIQLPVAYNSTDKNHSEERHKIVTKNKKTDDKINIENKVTRKRDASKEPIASNSTDKDHSAREKIEPKRIKKYDKNYIEGIPLLETSTNDTTDIISTPSTSRDRQTSHEIMHKSNKTNDKNENIKRDYVERKLNEALAKAKSNAADGILDPYDSRERHYSEEELRFRRTDDKSNFIYQEQNLGRIALKFISINKTPVEVIDIIQRTLYNEDPYWTPEVIITNNVRAFIIKIKTGDLWVLECSLHLKSVLMTLKEFIYNGQIIFVDDFVISRRCMKCHLYDHSTEECSDTEIICGNCGYQGHSFRRCFRKKPACATCIHFCDPDASSHRAGDFICPLRISEEMRRMRINEYWRSVRNERNPRHNELE